MTKQMWLMVCGIGVLISCGAAKADLAIQSFDSTGRLTFNTLNDGTNYNYQVEWAPMPSGPWSPFTGTGAWQDNITAQGSITSTVPMCYRVVATLGDYMVVDLSGGTNSESYPVSYYRTLADLPGGAGVNSDAYKTTNMVFRRIPAGTFTMGSPTNELGRDSSENQRRVTLSRPFYMGVFEVTQKQWERVMGTWPSFFTNVACCDARPAEEVCYDDIRGAGVGSCWPTNDFVDSGSFMGRLRSRTGMAFDLPTEAQWEYAARAGTVTSLNSGLNLTAADSCPNMSVVGRYWYNGGLNSLQNSGGENGTAKGGSYLPNAWGLYDIHGNVWEWCLDWHGAYLNEVIDPVGAVTGTFRVLRGGSWAYSANLSRSANRGNSFPNSSGYSKGFRVALAVAP